MAYRNEKQRLYQIEYRKKIQDKSRAYSKAYYYANKEKAHAKHKVYREKHRERLLKMDRENYHKKRETVRAQQLMKKYGLTYEQHQEMFRAQGGACSICGTLFDVAFVGHAKGKSNKAHVDHDHVSGKVRGLLCTQCNTALGLFKDNSANLAKAIVYLEKHNGR